jgi:cell division protein FtsW (lipid II flippase)
MAVVSVLAVGFSVVLCIVEIPKMLQEKLYRELLTFMILVALGTLLVILRSLDAEIPNHSDWIARVYLPVSEVMKRLFE